jgi:4-amino-4-deoxy-L-arabinose transferase-like glycosyltransferase
MKNNIIIFFQKYTVWLVILIAFALRFWQLGITPPSLYWDEVSQGYNAYSILKTGSDEHREFLPIARFQAFGDYKAPVYIYLDVLSIFVFGTTEFAVRFPSALLGTLTVLLTYYLTREIFDGNKRKNLIAGLSSLFLAISPWHIQLSRAAYEANVATFFTVLGLLMFFIAKRKYAFCYLISSLSFVLAFYSFNAHRVFIPLLMLILSIVYFKQIIANVRKALIAVFLAILLLTPFLFYLRTPESKLRFAEVNIFSDISIIEQSNHLQSVDGNSIIGKIFDNRRVLYGLSYVKHYFDFFNPTYLFFKGDVNPRFSTQDNGELYLCLLPLIIVGIYSVIKIDRRNRYFLLGWFILAPVAAATARETPHALRSETFIPLYEIFATFGLVVILELIAKWKKKILYFFLAALIAVMTYYLVDFLHTYYIHFPVKYSQDWQYGYKQAVLETESLKNEYDEIFFNNTYGRAYIYVLWYGKYAPQEFWKYGVVERDAFGFYNVHSFEKYNFDNKIEESKDKKLLFVGPPSSAPAGSRLIKKIDFLDGNVAFEIRDNQ